MRVLIIGGAGFVGSHLTESFLSDGHTVTVVDNFATGSRKNLPNDHGRLRILAHDMTEPLSGGAIYDTVCHLASIPTPSSYMDNPVKTLQTGSLVTRRTLELAAECGATYLFTSTSEVYGDPKQHPQSEDYNGNVDPYGPRSCYDESKRYAESLIRAYQQKYDLDTRIARIFNTYGPRMRDDRVVPAFLRQAQIGEPLTVHGDGTQTRSFCYVDDLIRGLRKLIDSKCQTPVNLGNPEEVSISHLADTVIDATGSGSSVVFTERPPDDPEQRKPDISKARRKLDWSPSVSLRDGIAKLVS